MGKIYLKKLKMNLAVQQKDAWVAKIRYASPIEQLELLKMASDDSGMTVEQLSAVWFAMENQIKELVLNGHSVEIANMGFFQFRMNAKAADTDEEAGAESVYRKKIGFLAKRRYIARLNKINFRFKR